MKNKQFLKVLAIVVLVVPLQLFCAGGAGKQVQMHVSNLDKALSIDTLEKALANLKQSEREDQTLNSKNRHHILSYLKKLRYHPEQDHSDLLKVKNEQQIARVVKDSYDSIKSEMGIDAANKFLDIAEGHIFNYKKPKTLMKHLRPVHPSRSVEPIVGPKVLQPKKRTTGIAGQLPSQTKPLEVSKRTRALPIQKASKGEMQEVQPLSKKAGKRVRTTRGDTRPHEYKKSAQQVKKEKEERAEKTEKKKESIREKREKKRLKKLQAQQ